MASSPIRLPGDGDDLDARDAGATLNDPLGAVGVSNSFPDAIPIYGGYQGMHNFNFRFLKKSGFHCVHSNVWIRSD